MIPLLIGAGVILGGAALLSDDDKNKNWYKESTNVRKISESELPPEIRKRLKESAENTFFPYDENTVVHERKVSEDYVRDQARKFNRPIKRGILNGTVDFSTVDCDWSGWRCRSYSLG